MSYVQDKKDPGQTSSSIVADLEMRGCATSFLIGARNETGKVFGEIQATNPEEKEYVQPDEEKETGGEARQAVR
jgi:hypothetical protein